MLVTLRGGLSGNFDVCSGAAFCVCLRSEVNCGKISVSREHCLFAVC